VAATLGWQNRPVAGGRDRLDSAPAQPPDRWFDDAASVNLQAELQLAATAVALSTMQALRGGEYLSLNALPHTVLDAGFEKMLEGWPLEHIMLEVTEHASIDDYGPIANRVSALDAACAWRKSSSAA
jgi:hypothetical protein